MDEKEELKKKKSTCTWLIGVELGDYLNKRAIADTYFHKSREWLSQRIIGNIVNGKEASFNKEEFNTFAEALRDIARRFQEAADSLDNAEL